MTLVQFDSQNPFEMIHDFVDLKKAKKLSDDIFIPRGMTPLLDAIGNTVDSTGKKLESMKEEDRPEKVIFVILTDGQENASSKFNREQIFEKIKHQTDAYNWKFVFLGANQDAIAEAAHLGINVNSTLQYASNPMGTAHAFMAMSSGMTKMRCCTAAADLQSNQYFSDEDRKKQEEAGAAFNYKQ